MLAVEHFNSACSWRWDLLRAWTRLSSNPQRGNLKGSGAPSHPILGQVNLKQMQEGIEQWVRGAVTELEPECCVEHREAKVGPLVSQHTQQEHEIQGHEMQEHSREREGPGKAPLHLHLSLLCPQCSHQLPMKSLPPRLPSFLLTPCGGIKEAELP